MKPKIIIYGLIFLIFSLSCNEPFIEADALTPNTTGLKSALVSTNRYVSKTGKDTNPGTLASPFLTIQKAATVAVAGDTVFIRAGVYQEQVCFENNGTISSRIVIMPYQSEIAVVDGNNFTIPVGEYDFSVKLYGNYITIKGIEIRYSHASGLWLHGSNQIADNIYSHHNYQSGIFLDGNNGTIQNCTTTFNCQNNVGGIAVLNGSGISAARAPDYPMLKNNIIHDNWGEGISLFECTHGTMQDNVSYDNWSANIYISDVTDCLVLRNYVYNTKGMTGGSQVGILVGDEKNKPQSARVTVINNVVFGCKRNLYWWGSNFGTGMTDFIFANNTFVNSTYSNCVQLNTGTDAGVQFKNNIISQNAGLLPILLNSGTGKTFSNNLWSTAPHVLASSKGDVIGDPKFISTTNFRLQSASPAINAGTNIGLTTDYLKNAIVGLPDIGAYEASDAPSIIYYNIQVADTATRNNCGTGSKGSTVTYTVAASKYSSTVSQADADSKATADLSSNKQAYANTNGTCSETQIPVYYNTQKSATATKNDCGTASTGSTVTYTVAASKYSSTVSQADADSKATTDLNTNKQAYANANGTCTTIPVFYNAQVSATATKSDCGTGYTGSTVTYSVAASKYSSTVSQTDANSKAAADLTANKQAYANANGICTALPVFYNAQVSATATRSDCGTGYTGSTVTYSIAASKYSSTVSQADADSKAAVDLSANKQSYANANGTCTATPITISSVTPTVYYNYQRSVIATKDNCGTGYTGSKVIYTVAAKKYSSTISQADADSKAAADLTANKQAYANTKGTCTPIKKVYYRRH